MELGLMSQSLYGPSFYVVLIRYVVSNKNLKYSGVFIFID